MDYFAHRIHRADLVNGVVNLQLSMVRPDEDGNYNPDAPVKPEDIAFTVNIPLQGFVRSMSVLRALMKELQEKGIVKAPEGEGKEGGERTGSPQRMVPGGGQRMGGPGQRGPGGRPGGPGGPGGRRGPGGPGGGQGQRPQVRDITNEDDSSEPLV